MPIPSKVYLGSNLLTSSYQSSSTYQRPSDWLTLPAAASNEVRALNAVFNQTENYCTIFGRTNDASQWFIDWGDGSAIETVSSNTTATHNYSFSAPALSGTTTSKGYKQAQVRVYANTGKTFYAVWFNQKASTPAGLQAYTTGWLDMNVNLPNLAAGGNLTWGTNAIKHGYLERINITSWGGITTLNNMFNNCSVLQSLNEQDWNTSLITSMNSTFFNCQRLTQLDCNGWNVSNVTDMGNMFRFTTGIQRIALSNWNVSNLSTVGSMFQDTNTIQEIDVSNWNTGNLTNTNSMFRNCVGLKVLNVRNWNMAKVTNINSMFSGCSSLQEIDISLWSLPLCTNAGDLFLSCSSIQKLENCNFSAATTFGTTFANNCYSLTSVTITGVNASISFTNCMLSATALDAIYTNLSATGTGKTITVTGNYGTATDNPAIATAKGWTVTG